MVAGLIGSKLYTSELKIIETIQRLKKSFRSELKIVSGGTREGAEYYIKKYTLEFSIDYGEFNPAYTQKNLYSIPEDSYYGKQYHGSQILHRYQLLIDFSDIIILFTENPLKFPFDVVIKKIKRTSKNYAIIL